LFYNLLALRSDFETMHPSLGQLTPEHALVFDPPLIDQYYRSRNQSSDTFSITDSECDDVFAFGDELMECLSKSTQTIKISL